MTGEESPLLQKPDTADQDLENGSTKPKIARSFLTVMLISSFLASSDDSFVLSTASDIAANFDATNASTWLITGFNLGYMISLPIYGQLCDAWGRKHTYLFSYIVYAVGCFTMGMSMNMYVAILGRVITGFGSSGMLDLSSILLNDIGGPTGVAVLRSYFMTVTMIGYSSGGAIGGLLATLIGWRWSFLIHVPIVLLCTLMAVLQLPKDSPTETESTTPETQDQSKEESSRTELDYSGMTLLVCTILSGLMMVQVLQADEIPGNTLYLSIGLGSASLLLGMIFCTHEMLWAKRPLIPLSFMLSSRTGVVCVVQILIMISDLALSSVLSEFFVRMKGFSMVAASASLAPPALGGAVGGYIAGRKIQSTGKYHGLTQVGLIITILSGVLIMIRWCFFTIYTWELIYSFPYGIGLGILFSTQFVELSAYSPEDYSARLITTYYLMQQIGSVVGVSVTAGVIRSFFGSGLKTIFGGDVEGMRMVNEILKHSRLAGSLPHDARLSVEASFRKSFFAAPLFGTAALVVTFYLVGRKPAEEKSEIDHDE
ncbi:hypothetical protein N7528_009882 [Penicillium herquei]|nr:hypothetical protein N7528_009882 [Penicillium herquei]